MASVRPHLMKEVQRNIIRERIKQKRMKMEAMIVRNIECKGSCEFIGI